MPIKTISPTWLPDLDSPIILAINGGSSTIKFAAFAPGNNPGHPLDRLLTGSVERIGLPDTALIDAGPDGKETSRVPLTAVTHAEAAKFLIDHLRQSFGQAQIAGIGHRVVHGGVHLLEHQLITPQVVAELKNNEPLDLAHLPREVALIETFRDAFPAIPQVACFDTAFHRDLPRVAQLLPIPLRYSRAGVRRFGFHGLSFEYLMGELARSAGPEASRGKIILAHLGSGASMAAVRGGKPVDTTMAFTPTAGLVMGTRPGDLDPGLLVYLMRIEKLSPEKMDEFINAQCGLLGLSETSPDMRDLLARRSADPRAADAVSLFCHRARQWIGALAASMDGLDTLVFSGGIGQHAPEVRAEISAGLGFLGLHIDGARNKESQQVISTHDSRVAVRVIATDEELVIARTVQKITADSARP